MNDDNKIRVGVAYGIGAYLLWGLLPIYWKLLYQVPALEILANRFIWSAVFVGFLLWATGGFSSFYREAKEIFSSFSTGFRLVLAAITVSFNWGVYIWAVSAGRIVETSMGYYINPLVSILFGVIFLKERLNRMQIIAVMWAALGIAVIVVKNGSLPWVSVSLAVTFALYGLLKKIIVASSLTTIMLETLIMSPIALYYIYSMGSSSAYYAGSTSTICLLLGAGIATATPLLLFTSCAKMIPLTMVGFLQYMSPTITLLLGVFVYGEAFTVTHMLAFGCIWIGLLCFTWSQIIKK